ncbi:MAG: hypothetical protein L3J89_03890 [Gammaproteobacteria bacterium]|nr:hypothetical protein [Gammaproteobacteria bacterium]
MELINGLLGFVVLTSPLWLFLILLPVSIWGAVKVARRFKRVSAWLVAGVSVFMIVFLVLFADEIVGRMYLNHLCATEAGTKVYKTVELPAEYWSEKGKPKFFNSRGVLVKSVLGEQFEWRRVNESYINWFIQIDKKKLILQDNKSKLNLGEKITFSRNYGWLNQLSSAPNVGESCREAWSKRYGQNSLFQKEDSEEISFLLKIFIPISSSI